MSRTVCSGSFNTSAADGFSVGLSVGRLRSPHPVPQSLLADVLLGGEISEEVIPRALGPIEIDHFEPGGPRTRELAFGDCPLYRNPKRGEVERVAPDPIHLRPGRLKITFLKPVVGE